MSGRKKPWHSGTYPARRNRLVARAYSNRLTKCWRCGRTLAEHPPHQTGAPVKWTAGHIRDSDPTSPLAPEASTCNSSAGAKYGNTGRIVGSNPRSRDWGSGPMVTPQADPSDPTEFALGRHVLIEHSQWEHRPVTLICGPPGSGKTTLAESLHSRVLDIGDFPPGTPRERMRAFGLAVYRVGKMWRPDVAVVRGAPTVAEREHQEKLAHPSRTIILLTDPVTCHERVTVRDRQPSLDSQHETVDTWWSAWTAEHERHSVVNIGSNPRSRTW